MVDYLSCDWFCIAVEDICHRYPKATEVNLFSNTDMHMLVMRAVSLLRLVVFTFFFFGRSRLVLIKFC